MRKLTVCYIKRTTKFWDGSTLKLSRSSWSRIPPKPFVIFGFLSMGKCVDVSQMNRFLSIESPISIL